MRATSSKRAAGWLRRQVGVSLGVPVLAMLMLTMVGLPACDAVIGIEDAELDPGILCDTYCVAAAKGCTGNLAVYEGTATCKAVCAQLPKGEPGAAVGNSINCRLRKAREASQFEPDEQCPAAGPGGDGTCGSNCEAFCLLFEQNCGPRFKATYNGLGDCQAKCATDIPDNGNFSVLLTDEDSVQCRLYHVSAATLDPGKHCGHAAGEARCVAGNGGNGGNGGGGGGGGNM